MLTAAARATIASPDLRVGVAVHMVRALLPEMSFGPPAQFGASWEEAFVYLDEQHPSDTDPSFAVDLLMTPVPVPVNLAAEARARLPPVNGVHARGYFHAVDDGEEAQSALADAIGGLFEGERAAPSEPRVRLHSRVTTSMGYPSPEAPQ